MDRRAWRATVHGVAESQTQLSANCKHTHSIKWLYCACKQTFKPQIFVYVDPNTHEWGKNQKEKETKVVLQREPVQKWGGKKSMLTWAITISHIKQNPKIDGNVYSSSWSWCACNRKMELWFSCEILGPRFPSGLNQSPVRGQDAEQGA